MIDNMPTLEEDSSPENALFILGSVPLDIPSHPHLRNLPPQCNTVEEVQKAYKIVKDALVEKEKYEIHLYIGIKNLLKQGKTNTYVRELFDLPSDIYEEITKDIFAKISRDF
jgi:hypothetical protein